MEVRVRKVSNGMNRRLSTEQSCSGPQTNIIEDIIGFYNVVDIDKMEMDAEKESICDRFSFNTTTDKLEKIMEGEYLVNMAKNNEWAYKYFKSWCTARNKQFPKM